MRKSTPRAEQYGGGLWVEIELESGEVIDGVIAQSDLLAVAPGLIRLQIRPMVYHTFARDDLKRAEVLAVIGPKPTTGTRATRGKERTLKPS